MLGTLAFSNSTATNEVSVMNEVRELIADELELIAGGQVINDSGGSYVPGPRGCISILIIPS